MTAKTTTPAAEQFKDLNEHEQGDLKHEAWSETVSTWTDEHADAYNRIESSSKVSWDDMMLEVYQDENGRDYFHIVTGVQHAPGHENGKQLFETVHDFMDDYRSELTARIRAE